MAQRASNNHKVLWLQLLATNNNENKAYLLCNAEDLSAWSYYQRTPLRQSFVFAARTSSERCPKGSRVTITLKEVTSKLHVYCRRDGLCGVAITNEEYPERVIQSLLTKLTCGFDEKYAKSWIKCEKDTSFEYAVMDDLLKKYQNPNEADSMQAIQNNLGQIKQIMHKNIEDILQRGETLDKLYQQSDDIGFAAKAFQRDANRMNACCQYL